MKLRLLIAILRHKWYVLFAGWRLKVPLWRLLVHDLSKFSPVEFGPYARHHYGDKGDPESYARAWQHHWRHNAHHWEHWPSYGLAMPEKIVREMVADWLAAGRAYEGRWPDLHNFTWFRENAHTMNMHPMTWLRLHTVMDEAAQLDWK